MARWPDVRSRAAARRRSGERLKQLWEESRILTCSDKSPRLDELKVYLGGMDAALRQSTLDDISKVSDTLKERPGYAMKKLALLDHNVRMSSNRGDVVMVPACGDFLLLGHFLGSATSRGEQYPRSQNLKADLSRCLSHYAYELELSRSEPR